MNASKQMNGIHHGNTNRPTRFSCCCEESHESKRVSCSMGWDSLESIFVPQRCVLFISFVVPISVFCIPYLSESFFFRSSSFEFLLWVIFNYLYVIVWFETRTICEWTTISLPAGCVNLVPCLLPAVMSCIYQSANVWHHTQYYLVQCKCVWVTRI